jgi:hypothetical protein
MQFLLRAAILMDRLHGIDGGLRTRLQRSPSHSRAILEFGIQKKINDEDSINYQPFAR